MTNSGEGTREVKYINGGCLSRRHAQAAYQKQNRSREPPRSLISTHASFPALYALQTRLFIVDACIESCRCTPAAGLRFLLSFRRYPDFQLNLKATSSETFACVPRHTRFVSTYIGVQTTKDSRRRACRRSRSLATSSSHRFSNVQFNTGRV